MANRMAAALALVAFSTCLVAGAGAGNGFTTAVWRALSAMAVTLAVGLVVGAMAQRMLDENIEARRKGAEIRTNPVEEDR